METDNNHSLHIGFVIPSMVGHGGAERVMSGLANHFSKKGCRVTLVTLDREDSTFSFPLDKKVEVIKLDFLKNTHNILLKAKNVFLRIKVLRAFFKKTNPSLVVSFLDTMNITTLLALKGLKIPVVVCERTSPGINITNPLINALRDLSYSWSDLVLTQTKRAKEFFNSSLQKKTEVIPNVVPQFEKKASSEKNEGKFQIVNVARLGSEKQLDLLIKAFSHIHEKYPDWEVVIYGEGAERKKLEDLRDRLGFQEKVFLPGVTKDVEGVLVKAHIMAFPSRFEGFPNALAEAISMGLSAIGFREVSGVEDLIVEGKNGFLVDPVKAEEGLAGALEKLMSDADLRKKFGDFGREHVKQWDESHVYALWEKTLLDVIKKNATTNT